MGSSHHLLQPKVFISRKLELGTGARNWNQVPQYRKQSQMPAPKSLHPLEKEHNKVVPLTSVTWRQSRDCACLPSQRRPVPGSLQGHTLSFSVHRIIGGGGEALVEMRILIQLAWGENEDYTFLTSSQAVPVPPAKRPYVEKQRD